MGHKHSKHEILAGAVAVANDVGLAKLTFGRVAKELGISDRTVVYYFPTKADLVGETIGAVGAQLQETLGTAFTTKAADYIELLRAAWPVVTTAEADPVFALFFEALGLAAAGQEPYRSLVPTLINGWIDWAALFLSGDEAERRAGAAAAVATIDGLLLLRQVAGPDVADVAARRLGVA